MKERPTDEYGMPPMGPFLRVAGLCLLFYGTLGALEIRAEHQAEANYLATLTPQYSAPPAQRPEHEHHGFHLSWPSIDLRLP